MDEYTTAWVIRYIFMGVSLGCSILTSIVIFSEQIYRQTFPQLILLIQLSFAVISILSMCFPAYRFEDAACAIIGYVISSLWFTTFTLTLLLLLVIERRFSGNSVWLNRINKRWCIVLVTCFLIPFVIGAIPITDYQQCGYEDMYFYCSLCSGGTAFWINQFVFTLVILCIAIFLLIRIKQRSKQMQTLGDELELSLQVMNIPVANFAILFLNLLTKTINVQGMFWVYMSFNLLFYLVPIINLYLFVRFMKQYPATIYHFTWLIRKKREKSLLTSRYVQM